MAVVYLCLIIILVILTANICVDKDITAKVLHNSGVSCVEHELFNKGEDPDSVVETPEIIEIFNSDVQVKTGITLHEKKTSGKLKGNLLCTR
ncbi:hypothetical protein C2G38_2157109 [Gigaspora rosea]|uniref:Uncharacterized protein n=1 Tax=Gigaspora rosea TaxID=44941 RepID=A0A397W203_9GLOM|nr:hypothetical protein C2G38_2157109 [Gigaspora rosea]